MKQGIVKIDGAGAATFEEGSGAVNMVMNAVKTIPSMTSAPVGYASAIQKVGLVLAGNALGINSTTGRLGVGVAGRNIYFGK